MNINDINKTEFKRRTAKLFLRGDNRGAKMTWTFANRAVTPTGITAWFGRFVAEKTGYKTRTMHVSLDDLGLLIK